MEVALVIDDTIAAISTPIGSAGIGIVRLSGKRAVTIAESIFRGKKRSLPKLLLLVSLMGT